MRKISIIGSGWVGGNVGRGLQKIGHDVLFYDVSEDKIRDLKDTGFNATNDLNEAVKDTEISFLCVPTPSKKDGIDLSYLDEATKKVGYSLKDKDDYHLIVVKSTVIPGTTENLVIPRLEEKSNKSVGKDIGVCMNPEFMTEISDTWSDNEDHKRNFFSEDRIVIGEYDDKSGDYLEDVYKPLNVPIIRTDLKTAEMIKYACNCALANRISYWNEIFQICQKLGIDSDKVAQVAAMDKRIGKYGTIHGKAFGGKCLPKDLKAFINFAGEVGHEPKLLKAVDEINERIKAERGVRE